MPTNTIPRAELMECTKDFRTLEEILSDGFENRDTSVKGQIERRLNRFLGNYGLAGVAEVVKDLHQNKGIRLRNLERALDVDRVVISGSVSFADSSVKDILRGNFKGEVESWSVNLRIRF